MCSTNQTQAIWAQQRNEIASTGINQTARSGLTECCDNVTCWRCGEKTLSMNDSNLLGTALCRTWRRRTTTTTTTTLDCSGMIRVNDYDTTTWTTTTEITLKKLNAWRCRHRPSTTLLLFSCCCCRCGWSKARHPPGCRAAPCAPRPPRRRPKARAIHSLFIPPLPL